MTCIQRNSLVFISTTFILLLNIQPSPVDSFHHDEDDSNQFNPSSPGQYNHLRHHHNPLRNRQVQHYQQKTTATNVAVPGRSVEKIRISSHDFATNRHRTKDRRHQIPQNGGGAVNKSRSTSEGSSVGGSTPAPFNQFYNKNLHNQYDSRHHTMRDRNSFGYEMKEDYQRKSSGSKSHSDRMQSHHPVTTTNHHYHHSQHLTRHQKTPPHHSWQLHRDVPQLKSFLLENSKNDLEDSLSQHEDYYDDDEGGNDEVTGKEEDAVTPSRISFHLPGGGRFKVTPMPIPSTQRPTQYLHSDFSYDYLYDEPTNDTDDKQQPPGSLTEEKWRNYGTAEAVEKSRRRHLSEAQIIAVHITRINLEAMCKYPRPKIIQINEASKRYVPHCTVLHRCGDDTGCCHSETQTCVAKKTVTVDLHFYAIPLKTKDPMVEVLSFVNHTECHCVDRFPARSTTFAPDSQSNGSHLSNRTCNCIRHFDIFEEDFDEENDNQYGEVGKHSQQRSHSNCRCDCTSDNLTCQRLKRGQEGIPVDDRRCISENRCQYPTCEYGEYNRHSGRCPRSIVKRTVSQKASLP